MLTGLMLTVLLLPFVTLIAYAAPDAPEQDSSKPDDLSGGQIIGLTVSAGVALGGLWLYFRKPKSKQSVAPRHLV